MLDDKSPLWLPPGSVRSIIALALVAAFIVALFLADVADIKDVVLVVIGFYFGSRTSNGSSS